MQTQNTNLSPQLLAIVTSAPTMIPPCYPELEQEMYLLLEPITDRETYAPPPSSQMGLELECLGLEVTL